MARVLAKVAAVVLALGAFGGAAQAGGIEIRITTTDRHYGPPPTAFHGVDDDDDHDRRRYVVAPGYRYRSDDEDDRRSFAPPPRYGHGYAAPGRYYGRPVPERGYWDRHSYSRPVRLPGWRQQRYDDCRIVIQRTVKPWGEVILKQKQVCD